MSTDEFKLLADLYRFLSEYDPATLQKVAGRRSLSKNLRMALQALLREARTATPASGSSRRKPRSADAPGPLENLATSDPDRYRTRMANCLIARFPKKGNLVQFLKQSGIPLTFSAKDGAAAAARKAARHALAKPNFRASLHEALRKLGNGQTQGWLDIIGRSDQ